MKNAKKKGGKTVVRGRGGRRAGEQKGKGRREKARKKDSV